MKTAVLGASDKPERYSNKAIRMLLQHQHEVVPIHPALSTIEGIPVSPSLQMCGPGIDTVTVYLNAETSSRLEQQFLAVSPRRVIFNPGAENPQLAAKLRERGILVQEACTLVLLTTGQF